MDCIYRAAIAAYTEAVDADATAYFFTAGAFNSNLTSTLIFPVTAGNPAGNVVRSDLFTAVSAKQAITVAYTVVSTATVTTMD